MAKLRDIVDALELQFDEGQSYLNRQTGEIVALSNKEMSAAEEGADIKDFQDWQQELIRKAIDILETDHYVELPSQHEINDWSIMQDFADALQEGRVRDALLSVLQHKGTFRHFKDTLYRHGIEKQWFAYRIQALEKIARDWLIENEIPFEEGTTQADLPPPPKPQIVALDHVQLAMPVGEEDKARSFYVGILALQEVPKPPNLAKRGGVWFELDSVRVHLGVEQPFLPAKKAHPAFLVKELDALIARCQQAGYEVTPDDQIPGVQRVYIHDPFGNRIELIAVE